jgi:hypothetical protein
VFAWVNGPELEKVFVEQLQTWAERKHALDLPTERRREEAKLLAAGGGPKGTPEFERLLDDRVRARVAEHRAGTVAAEMESLRAELRALRILEGAALSLGGDERNVPFTLYVDVGVTRPET